MRAYTIKIFFNDGSDITVNCDDFIANENRCYAAVSNGIRIMTIPFESVKYTTLVTDENLRVWRN